MYKYSVSAVFKIENNDEIWFLVLLDVKIIFKKLKIIKLYGNKTKTNFYKEKKSLLCDNH